MLWRERGGFVIEGLEASEEPLGESDEPPPEEPALEEPPLEEPPVEGDESAGEEVAGEDSAGGKFEAPPSEEDG